MDTDCGVLVVSRHGKLLAANPLAESFLARPLPSGSFLKANGPLAPFLLTARPPHLGKAELRGGGTRTAAGR